MLPAIFYCDGIFWCYKSYPLKENLVPRFGGIGKQEEDIQDILER
jgi:hypothetical protein